MRVFVRVHVRVCDDENKQVKRKSKTLRVQMIGIAQESRVCSDKADKNQFSRK